MSSLTPTTTNEIKENAIKKRKSIKSYRKEQTRLTEMRNKLFEEQLHERRQSELDKIKQEKKYEKMSLFSFGKNNKKNLFQRIKNKFNKPQKSVRKKKVKHSKTRKHTHGS